MSWLDKFTWLCLQNGVSASYVCEKIGVSRSAYSRWRKGDRYPSNATMRKIADYFNVSVDSLTDDALELEHIEKGHEDIHINKQEKELIDIYRSLSLKGQMHLIRTAMELKDDDK